MYAVDAESEFANKAGKAFGLTGRVGLALVTRAFPPLLLRPAFLQFL